MTTLRMLVAHREIAAALEQAAAWCSQFDFSTPAIDSAFGRSPAWVAVLPYVPRLRHAYVAVEGLRSEPHALDVLHRHGALRLVPAADGSFRAHVFRFRNGNRVRVVTGAGAFTADGLMAPLEAVTVWEGSELDRYALDVERALARARRLAHVPELAELERYSQLYFQAASHRDALAEIGAPLIRQTADDVDVAELDLVLGRRETRDAMQWAKEQLAAASVPASRQTLGFQGGNIADSVHWSAALGIWSLLGRRDGEYASYFGVNRPDLTKSLQITVQANVPASGPNRRKGGALARDRATGRQFLVHRGRIGGGQKGIGSELFWRHFRGGARLQEPDREEASRVLVIGEIGSASFPRDVAAFVHQVARIKRAAA